MSGPTTAGGGGDDVADVVVVGGGHNGLVTAAYLARAGLDVVVLERNERCGGALFSTVRDGVVLEHGGVEHTTIVATTIPDELELERHGLHYAVRTLGAIHRFGDEVELRIAESAADTAASIGVLDRRDADAWLDLADLATRMFALVAAVGEGRAPTMAALVGARRLLAPSDRRLVDLATAPVLDVASEWFVDPHVRAMAVARAGFSGLPAWEPGTGAVFCLTPAGHGRRYARPVGGSAAFIDALVGSVLAAGGRIVTGTQVVSIAPNRGLGRSRWLIDTDGGTRWQARHGVVSAVAPTALLDLTEPGVLAHRLREGLTGAREVVGNLSQFTLAAVLDRPPPLPATIDAAGRAAMLWLLDDPADVLDAQVRAAVGGLPRRPGVLVTFPSEADPASAPGAATMWVNGFLARRLANGRRWRPSDADEAQAAIWGTIGRCLPGVGDRVVHQVFTSPDDLTDRTGAVNPGSHLAAILDQLLGGRPVRGFARHRAGGGLYLTGAGTGQGPSISGLPGRACAEAVLDDLAAKGLQGRARVAVDAARAESRRAQRLLALLRTDGRG